MKKLAPLREWPRAYPNLPIWLGLIGLVANIVALILRSAR